MPLVSNAQIDEIVLAVQAIHSGVTPNSQRLYFTQAIENLKDNDPINAVEISFYLISHNESTVKHLGWNILEHIIKYKWLLIDCDLRMKIREEILHYISQGQYLLNNNDLLIKTAISRSIVCIIENEWVPNWTELFPKFQQIVNDPKLFCQSQMIFIILKRLVEDIVTLSTIENINKRRDLSTLLSANMREILTMSLIKIRFCIENEMNDDSILLAKAIIELLTEIVEWIVNKILEEFITEIVDAMCAFLQTEKFDIYEDASKCLWKLASRKFVKVQEAPIVISLFRNNPMQIILSAANYAAELSPLSVKHYKYLKVLCDLLCALGIHLADIWSFLPDAPLNFDIYLSTISLFFLHPSIYICAETSQVLSTFAAHKKISKNNDFINCISKLFQHLPRYMEKDGLIGSQNFNNNLTIQYSQIDYEDEDELLRDFLFLREKCCKIIRDCTLNHFDKIFSIIYDWIFNRFAVQIESIDSVEFDMLKRFINSFFIAENQTYCKLNIISPEHKKTFVSVFDMILMQICSTNNLKTANGALSILSAFFHVFEDYPDRVLTLLTKLKDFLMLENQNNEDANLLSLKRHSIILLLKLISSYPKATKLYAHILLNIVIEVSDRVTIMQRASLVHILGALSNLAESSMEQNLFLQNALQHNIQYLKSENYITCVSSAKNFLTYIGLTSMAPLNEIESQNSVFFNNRLELRSHLSAVEGLLQHVNLAANKTNALFSLLQPFIPSFFHLAKCLNSIYETENINLIHSSYGAKVLDITSHERQIILFSTLETEINEKSINKSSNDPIAYTRRYLIEMIDLIQNILGLIGSKFFAHFYYNSIDLSINTSELICDTLYSISNVPDYHLRFWIRRTWNKLVCNCPVENYQIVIKLVINLTRHFHQLIGDRWNEIKNRSDESKFTEEELFAESLISVLSREYASFLKNIIIGEVLTYKSTRNDSIEYSNPLGYELLKNKDVLENTIASIAKLINCSDAQAAIKVIPVANVILLKHFSQFDEDMSKFLLIQTIKGLQIHGSDDVILGPLLSLIFTIYSLLRPIYPSLITILTHVPDSAPEAVLNFDERVLTMIANNEKLTDKNKRELLRKILKPVIALNISEQHKRTVQLRQN